MELITKETQKTYLHNKAIDDWYKKEKQVIEDRKKQFKLVKEYDKFDLYEHKTLGYKECFKK